MLTGYRRIAPAYGVSHPIAARITHGWIQPGCGSAGRQYQWHTIMDVGQVGIWRGGDDRAALDLCTLRVDPSIPEPGECKKLTVADLKGERLLGLAVALPLIEAVCGNQTALRLERIAE